MLEIRENKLGKTSSIYTILIEIFIMSYKNATTLGTSLGLASTAEDGTLCKQQFHSRKGLLNAFFTSPGTDPWASRGQTHGSPGDTHGPPGDTHTGLQGPQTGLQGTHTGH